MGFVEDTGGVILGDVAFSSESRKEYIGASDIPALRNIGYGCRRRLFFEKRHGIPDADMARINKHLERGKGLEGFAFDLAQKQQGFELVARGNIEYRHGDAIRVHLDGIIKDENGEYRVAEVKNPGVNRYYKIAHSDEAPDDYRIQTVFGCAVSGIDRGRVIVFNPDAWDVVTFDVFATVDEGEELIADAQGFMENVFSDDPVVPDALPPDDKRCALCPWRNECHENPATSADITLASKGVENEDRIDRTFNEDIFAEWVAVNAEITRLSKRAKQLEESMYLMPGVNVFRSGAIKVSQYFDNRIDTKRLKAEAPDIAEKYMKRVQRSRKTVIYFNGEDE